MIHWTVAFIGFVLVSVGVVSFILPLFLSEGMVELLAALCGMSAVLFANWWEKQHADR